MVGVVVGGGEVGGQSVSQLMKRDRREWITTGSGLSAVCTDTEDGGQGARLGRISPNYSTALGDTR